MDARIRGHYDDVDSRILSTYSYLVVFLLLSRIAYLVFENRSL
jgi:hypothetical protein